MRAILRGGIYDRKIMDVDIDEPEIIFTRHHCGDFPNKGYQSKHRYELTCIVNLGVPVAYFDHYSKPAQKTGACQQIGAYQQQFPRTAQAAGQASILGLANRL